MVSRYLETENCDNMFYPLCKMPLINHEEKKNDMSGHKCGYHWKLFNGKCYTISYRFERAEMRYEEAIAFCSSLHKESSLAKITSKDEIKWLCNTSYIFWVPKDSSYWVIKFYLIFEFSSNKSILKLGGASVQGKQFYWLDDASPINVSLFESKF